MEPTDTHNDQANIVFSRKILAGRRIYFIDVRSMKTEGNYYITITEARKITADNYERHRIILFQEDFKKFVDALGEAVDVGKHGPKIVSEAPVDVQNAESA